MKGISNIIAIILILLITVSLAALAYLFFTGLVSDLFGVGGNQTQQFTFAVTSLLKIETINNNIVYIRNIGQSKVTDFFVSVNDIPVVFSAPDELDVGELGNITLTATLMGIKSLNNVIEITTAQLASATGKISGFTGKVLSDSNPVSSATVNVLMSNNLIASTTTDSEGNYAIYISPGIYNVEAAANNLEWSVMGQSISEGEIRTVDINLGTSFNPQLVIVNKNESHVFVKNNGDSSLSGFQIFLNNVKVNPTLDKNVLQPQEILTIRFSNYLGNEAGNKIKVTTVEGPSVEEDFGIHFYDDFDDGIDDGWSRSDSNSVAVVNGEYRFSGQSSSTIQTASFSNFSLEYGIKHDSAGGWGGVRIRGTVYYIVSNCGGYFTRLLLYDGPNENVASADVSGDCANIFINMKVEAKSNNIKVYVDDVKYIDYTDGTSPSLSGSTAVYRSSSGGTYTFFDNIKIRSI